MSPGRQLGLIWGGVAGLVAAAAPFLPRLAALAPPCLLKTFTGLPCPGCGSTRAALALVSGHPLRALAWNPLGAGALVLLVAGGFVAGARALAGYEVKEPHTYPAWLRFGTLTLLLGNWVYLILAGR